MFAVCERNLLIQRTQWTCYNLLEPSNCSLKNIGTTNASSSSSSGNAGVQVSKFVRRVELGRSAPASKSNWNTTPKYKRASGPGQRAVYDSWPNEKKHSSKMCCVLNRAVQFETQPFHKHAILLLSQHLERWDQQGTCMPFCCCARWVSSLSSCC